MRQRNVFRIITGLAAAFLLSVCFLNGSQAQASPTEEQKIEQVVRLYFESSYEQFNALEYPDLSDVLDMSSIQCQNKIELFKDIVDNYKYCMDTGWDTVVIEKLPYSLTIDFIQIKGDEADVQFKLKWLTEHNVFRDEDGSLHLYPFFMTFGTNLFHLNKRSGQWKIDQHDNSGYDYDFDLSREKLIPYDKEKADEIRRGGNTYSPNQLGVRIGLATTTWQRAYHPIALLVEN